MVMAVSKISTGWRQVKTVTLPFTAEHDGFLYMNLNPNSSANAYYYIQDGSSIVGNLVARDGTRAQLEMPVRAGHTYSLNASSNVKTITLTAYYLQ